MSDSSSRLRRRDFLRATGLGAAALGLAGSAGGGEAAVSGDRPNILWFTSEDNGPALGCYGDTYASTPNLDRFAAEGLRYKLAFATAPVCAPARSCLITGMYATTLGSQHLRSEITLPPNIKCFTEYLRKAGYYCSNNVKQDYNFAAPNAWDESSTFAHWRNRKPGQPFFSVFNTMTTHQSRLDDGGPRFFAQFRGSLPPEQRHDPDKAPIPPYYPDTPMVRDTIARYYDLMSVMDREFGAILKQLEKDGLADDTIVFYYGDHGFGLPRHKRALPDSGLQVPLLVRFPKKYQHLAQATPGTAVDRMVSFVDFAPTVLSLAGVPIPEHMQGTAFLGAESGKPREYIYGAASRVDEAFECSRAVRDERYEYIRNYLPNLPYFQKSAWPDEARIAKELRRLAAAGKLEGPQTWFSRQTKPLEELYDTKKDPYAVSNLVDSPDHRDVLERLRAEHKKWVAETLDLGFMPEAEMDIRADGKSRYEMARTPGKYPQDKIVAAASLVGAGPDALPKMREALGDSDSVVRFWGATAIGALGAKGRSAARDLVPLLKDPSPDTRIAAAAAICRVGRTKQGLPVLAEMLDDERPLAVLRAAREIELLGRRARPILPKIKATLDANVGGIYEMFICWALEGALENCGETVLR